LDLQRDTELGFGRLLERMAASGIADQHELRGCTSEEIAFLEAYYGRRLPHSYRRYLELMGHKSGKLFTSDHMAVFYKYVLELTDDFSIQLRSGARLPATFQLPTDAFLIAGRLGETWQFIRCGDANDSPVWTFSEQDWVIAETHASVLDWLTTWCGIADDAIAGGYFELYPNGTTP
jgi:hypothetical protein